MGWGLGGKTETLDSPAPRVWGGRGDGPGSRRRAAGTSRPSRGLQQRPALKQPPPGQEAGCGAPGGARPWQRGRLGDTAHTAMSLRPSHGHTHFFFYEWVLLEITALPAVPWVRRKSPPAEDGSDW